MTQRYLCALLALCALVVAAGLTLATAAFTQTTEQQETPITLIGCVQRESDYRQQRGSGRGGPVGTGAGLGNEFVLVNAMKVGGTPAATTSDTPCPATTATGDAYELTGSRESELEAFVGRRIEITGTLKRAETVGTTGAGTPKPSGGVDPLGQDLELPEVNVTSFREPEAGAAAAPQPEPQPEPQPQAAQPTSPEAPQPPATTGVEPGTTGVERQLPSTAGSLPLVGLVGLLSLGGALGIRALTRR